MEKQSAVRLFKQGLYAVVFVMALAAMSPEVYAQPVLNFKRIVNNWPTIELYFQVTCDGQPSYVFNKEQNFKVYENGIEVGEFTLWCPDPRQRCAISVALVFDASLSMSGNAIAGSKAAGHLFIDLMDGVIDEAAIIFFTTPVWIEVGMTTNKTDLHDAVNALGAISCCSAVWDGIYVGLQELVMSGSNPCRAVIALTDGRDNASIHTPTEVIALANRNRVRVFTIGLGNVNYSDLQTVATLTGGEFYQAPSPSQLVGIYEEISTIIYAGFNECLITYQAKCLDGGLRTVDLELLQFCQGGDKKTRSYRAARDTGTFEPLEIEIGKAAGRGNSEVQVPLTLVTPIMPRNNLEPAKFTVLFDETCAQFVRFETPPGTLLAGVPITIEPVPGGVSITTEDRIQVEGAGTLGEFTFLLSDPDDTTCCEVELGTWVFTAGCYKPVLKSGEVCIYPRSPVMSCTMTMPNTIHWVRSLKDYTPNPFEIRVVVSNSGDKPAENTHFKIDFDPGDFTLRSPIIDIQPGTPLAVEPGQISEAAWSVQANRRLTGDSVRVCISASFDNHEDVTCCQTMWIPPTEAILACAIDPVIIIADNDNQRYDPMPFDLTVHVTNRGGKKTDSVHATIVLPDGFELAGTDAPDNNTKAVTPGLLLPNQSGDVSWTVWHPIVLTETEQVIQVWVKTSNADSSLCEVLVIIPPLDAPSLRLSCQTPDELVFNEPLDAYVPNPFTVSITSVNLGKMAADSVSVFLYLPDDVELDPPGQPLRVTLGTMNTWKTGDPIPSASWTVRWTKKYRYNTVVAFKWALAGIGRTGLPTDSVYAHCETAVPGLKPSFDCEITAPDSLALNAAGTNVEPNPFTLQYRIWNTSRQVASIDRITAFYSNDGISLDASVPGNDQTKVVSTVLNPSEELIVDWVFKVAGAITPRNPQFRVVAYDDEGNPIACEVRIPIAPLKTALVCDLSLSESVLVYDPLQQSYPISKWTATATFTNAGGFDLSNASAEIIVNDPDGYVQFDSGYPNDNPWFTPVVFQGQSRSAEWGFSLAKPNTTGVSQYVEFVVNYGSNETPWIEGACSGIIEIRPVYAPSLVCSIIAPDTVYFNQDRYVPDVFDVLLEVRNIGNGDAENVQAFVLQDHRFTVTAGASPIHTIGTIPAGKAYNYGDFKGFAVKIKPRGTSGYDTLTVVVVADGIPEAICFFPVYIEAELRPWFELVCTVLSPDIVYNDDVNSYVPNPIEIQTTVTNTGKTAAKECELVFVGPRKFEPYGQNSHHPLQTPSRILNPGESYSYTWKLNALLQEYYSSESVVFQVHGRGGLNNDVIVDDCAAQVDIPPARAASYTLTCTAPDSIQWNPSAGVYNPDPFVLNVRVENTGQADGRMIDVSFNNPQRVFLAQGETTTKTIFLLPAAKDTTILWRVRPVAGDNEVTVAICTEALDKDGGFGTCCTEVYIPKSTGTDLNLSCSAETDTLHVDMQAGDYSPNPFEVYLALSNESPGPIHDIQATLIRGSGSIVILDEAQMDVAAVLGPGQSIGPLVWRVRMKPVNQPGCEDLVFRVTSSNSVPRECRVTICYDALGTPRLDCNLYRVSAGENDDLVLNFDTITGDYEGIASGYGYTVFTLTANVMNVGELPARSVSARIAALDGGVTLADGESPTKPVVPDDIGPMGNATVSWRFKPERTAESAPQRFQVCILGDNSTQVCCEYEITIEGAPKTVDLSIPSDIVGQFGDKLAVPVVIGRTIGLDVFMYRLVIQFDEQLLRFVDVASAGTSTDQGWSGPRASAYAANGSRKPNTVVLQDFTTGSPLNTLSSSILIYMIFEAVYGGDDGEQMGYAASNMQFLEHIDVMGDVIAASINHPLDSDAGEVYMHTVDGLVTISGECIVPLTAAAGYHLAQNIPNPFNPETTIRYAVPEEARVRIDIMDVFGRVLQTLVDDVQQKGSHQVVFSAEGLPSGIYFCRMSTVKFNKIMKMIIEK